MVALVGLVECFGATPAEAQSGWSVYIFNTCRPQDGWYRSGFADDINTTQSRCLQSINQRIREATARGTNRERYVMVRYNRNAPQVLQSGYVGVSQIYNSSATCKAERCPNRFYAEIRNPNGSLGYLGGYSSRSEAERYGRSVNGYQGYRFTGRVIEHCP